MQISHPNVIIVLFLPSSTHYQSAQRVEMALRSSLGQRLLVCTFSPGSPRVSVALCRWSMVSLSTVSWEKVTPIPCRQRCLRLVIEIERDNLTGMQMPYF